MSELNFNVLLDRLCTGDESVEIEAKRAEEIGASVQETICAFANEPNRCGGYILLGVAVSEGDVGRQYEVVGVPDPDKAQADLASQCRSVFDVPVRPIITADQCEGQTVLTVYVPESPPHEKPVYIQRRGVQKGAYRRIGSTDQVCTDDDLAMLYQGRGGDSYDQTPVGDASADDVDPDAVAEYRRLRAAAGGGEELLRYSDADLLLALGATRPEKKQTRLTVAGLLLFGKPLALRRIMPMTRVDYIRVEGREWVPDPARRYHSVEKLGPLLLTIPALVAQVMEDIPKAFTLPEGSVFREDVPLVPRDVVREAIVNALMHRTYRKHQPVQIIRYSNRIEVRNPGHSLKPEEQLGEPGSVPRNPKIAAVLHDLRLAETKGTGIRAMRAAMERANLTLPLFDSDRVGDNFTVTLLVHHLLGPDDVAWLAQFSDCGLSDDEARAMIVVREMGAINNALYRNVTRLDTLTASNHLRRLRDLGLLEQRGKASGTYYLPGERVRGTLVGTGRRMGALPAEGSSVGRALSTELSSVGKALSTKLSRVRKGKEEALASLPPQLVAAVKGLGRRATPGEVRAVIHELCLRHALQARQLAALLGRAEKYLRVQFLGPMVQSGELEYVYPEDATHPQQAYRTKRFAGEGARGEEPGRK